MSAYGLAIGADGDNAAEAFFEAWRFELRRHGVHHVGGYTAVARGVALPAHRSRHLEVDRLGRTTVLAHDAKKRLAEMAQKVGGVDVGSGTPELETNVQ